MKEGGGGDGNGGERGVKDTTTTRRSPGSGDVLTLRTRSLIGDDLWRHSIFRPSSKGNRRNKYGHRYVLPIPRTRFTRERKGGNVKGGGRGDRCFHRSRAHGSPGPPARLQMSWSDFWRLLEFPRLGRFSVDVPASEKYFTIYRDLLFLVYGCD